MKKCPKCHELYSDSLEKCPDCDVLLESYDKNQPSKVEEFFDKYKDRIASCALAVFKKYTKVIVSCALVASFLLGFGFKSCTGIKKTDYKDLQSRNEKLQSQYDELSTEKDTISKEYDDYKSKMQPYESIQLADAQNKAERERQELAEKKAAEEKAAAEAKAKQEAEEKAAAEAKAAEIAKGYETGITFDNLARTPDNYKGKKVKFSGKVIQVLEGTTETQIRLAVNNDYDKVIFCRIPKAKTTSMRVLENDHIHIMGVSNGLISYQSTMGGNITIPDIIVDDWGQS